MAKLTVRALDAARAKDKPYKLTVDKGLYMRVATNGEKRWLVKYTTEGKQKEVRLALYGSGEGFMTLAQAVAENGRIQALAAQETDFKQLEAEKKAQAEAKAREQANRNKTFHDMFTTWLDGGVSRQDGNAELIRTFEKDVLPAIGNKPVRTVTEQDIRKIYRDILARGTELNPRERTVVSVANSVRQVFKWAEQRQPWRTLLANGNPALLVDVSNLLSDDYVEERDRVLSIEEIRTLDRLIREQDEAYQNATDRRKAARAINPRAQCAIWLCFATICRIGELLMSRWEHVDLEARRWSIPRENVKGRGKKKQDHYVYLSDFALTQFKRLQNLTGESEWCFPSKDGKNHVCVKSVSKIIGDRQEKFKDRPNGLKGRRNDNTLVIGDEEWTPHDLRRTGATMMQELGVPLDIIDRCQNHVLGGSRVRRHYLKYDYAKEKQEAWQKLGDRIEAILKSDNLVSFKAA